MDGKVAGIRAMTPRGPLGQEWRHAPQSLADAFGVPAFEPAPPRGEEAWSSCTGSAAGPRLLSRF